ncbi:MAG: NADH-quinone oxidoreductase subunit N [Bryobacterales bacterium]|nr:NADH-quinone oxidoreductase subunit N [Bryobacteraceae bacterium]MDW8130926.1 NADH-quinone oxidoreductase subunit N [Bryobacterales bacterium]
MSQFYTSVDHFALVPALMLALFGCAVLLFDFFVFPAPRQRKWLVLLLALGIGFAALGLVRQYAFLKSEGLAEFTAFRGTLTIDGFAIFFNGIFLAASLLVALVSYRYLEIEGEHHGEYYGLILLANCGMYFLATGTDLVTLFVGLELMAICFYIMVGFLRLDRRSNEAAIKYLLLGAFSSGFLAYGFSLMYGLAGSTRLADITAALAARPPWDPLVFLAMATTAVGLFFKVSLVPFHMWAPDAYEGAPTTVTAYLSVASKAASFALLVRIFLGPLAGTRAVWQPLLAAVAVATLTVGNLAAVTQTNVKRLLAYSSISHAGYILLGLVAGNPTGIKGIAVYLLVYTFMNLGAFLVLIALRRQQILGEELDDLSGLMHKSPAHAILMLIFLLSLAGIPPTAGFIAKYYIFWALIQAGQYWLAAIAAAYVAVAVYYYFRIVRSMFVSELSEREPLASSFGLRLALGVTGVLTLAIGVHPEPWLELAQNSVLLR